MKRRVRVQPTNPYYTDEPAVAKSLIADKGLVQNPSLGNAPPKVVDKKPGRMSGLAGFVNKTKPITKPTHISQPSVSAKAKAPAQGHLRMSGNPKAHRLGGVKLKV